jgi:uncharacterized protein (DUF1684 family)
MTDKHADAHEHAEGDAHEQRAHEHDGHDNGEHEHVHTFDWAGELEAMRQAAKHYYDHQFDWKGQGPPEGFDGPRYYAPTVDLRLLARLDQSAPGTGDKVTLATSTGKLREMEVAGDVVFDVGGIEHRLRGFFTHDSQGYRVIFLPFKDLTSGGETYGAGRYVEVEYEPDDEELELDFNLAYNPSCAFSPTYDCPYPPPGNRLNIEVRAGEMLPSGKAAG